MLIGRSGEERYWRCWDSATSLCEPKISIFINGYKWEGWRDCRKDPSVLSFGLEECFEFVCNEEVREEASTSEFVHQWWD